MVVVGEAATTSQQQWRNKRRLYILCLSSSCTTLSVQLCPLLRIHWIDAHANDYAAVLLLLLLLYRQRSAVLLTCQCKGAPCLVVYVGFSS